MKTFKRIAAVVLTLCLVLGVFAACSASPEKEILGKWSDSTGFVGYEFKENNAVEITYADFKLPFLGKYTGSVQGAYSINKGEDNNYYVKIEYTLISRTLSENYRFAIDGDTLTLTNAETGNQTVFMRVAGDPGTTPAQ